MQLNITTDYAIRTILYLGSCPKNAIVPSTEIAEKMKIPHNYLNKVLRRLRKEGLIFSVSGVKGGYVLRKELKSITLGEILRTMERTLQLNPCLEEGECNRCATNTCKVRQYFLEIQRVLEKNYFSITMDQLLSEIGKGE